MDLLRHWWNDEMGRTVGTCKPTIGCGSSWESGIGSRSPGGCTRGGRCGGGRCSWGSSTRDRGRPRGPTTWAGLAKPCGRLPGATRRREWSRRWMRGRVRARRGCWTQARARASWPWCAANRRQAGRGGGLDSSPRQRGSGSWCRGWAGRRSAFCSGSMIGSRGGKKMWCRAALDQESIAGMEDVLAV